MATRRSKALLIVGALILVLVAAGVGFLAGRSTTGGGPAGVAEQAQRYHCPMHPTYISDEPGECPICGMDFVLIEEEEGEEKVEGIPGLAAVKISTRKQQLIGVRKGRVERKDLTKVIRTVGIVEPDETRIFDVTTKISGWVEKLYVDATGEFVKQGQPLLTIYSPEVVATQRDYLLALKARDRLTRSRFPEVFNAGESLADAARERLELWDIPQSAIENIRRTGKTMRTVTLRAPSTGYVLEKNVFEGMRVTAGGGGSGMGAGSTGAMGGMASTSAAGMSGSRGLYRVADLSRVWVQADVYEYELPLVEVGQLATLTVESYPNETFSGKVSYLYPYMETRTRTMKARFEFSNPRLKLKPGMYANVELKVPLGEKLAVPEEAVLDSGTRQVVFRVLEDGYFQPRDVKLGMKVDDWYEVLSGLEEGDEIVVSGNFMIDSESRLKAALSGMGEAMPAGHQH